MSTLSDKVSYLRGLAEGMKLDTASNEGKLFTEIIEALNLVSEKVDALDESYDELNDYVEAIDDDLEALEVRTDEADEMDEDEDDDDEYEFDDDDEYDAEFDEDEDECDCGCHHHEQEEDEDAEDAPDMYVGCLCSECGGMFSVPVDADEEQMFICPHCNKRVKAVQMNCHNVPVAETSDEDEDEDK